MGERLTINPETLARLEAELREAHRLAAHHQTLAYRAGLPSSATAQYWTARARFLAQLIGRLRAASTK